MPRRFINDLTRADVLEELRSLSDDDGLNHASELNGRPVTDPLMLSDEDLRELLKLARWRALLWRELDE